MGVTAWGRQAALLLGLLSGAATATKAQTAPQALWADSANVVLVTIDGLRWEELFSGAEARLLSRCAARKGHRDRYDRPTAEARRQALFPFLWDSIGRRGQLFGNRALGNCQDLTNRCRLSYPGYNEMLTGAADDERIRGNRHIPNPNETVLEFLNRQPGFAGQVAAFTSWEAFPFILNQPRSGLPVDAGLNGAERADSLTYRAARRYLAQARPRVLYLAFGNTDTFAHVGRYGDYLDAAHAIDGYLAELWAALQALPQYRGRTTLLITTDHGRGRGRLWTQHGRELRASAHTWLAAMGPGIAPLGEVRTPAQHHQTRLAGMVARCLGVEYPAVPTPAITLRLMRNEE
ncbi:alkaline phosphatase family protein [Hymenobacter sp.]|uniref:alkaline phosphatase family protein n=1 Tax=Hymenobacter sp. TaxID=1898978 RepID=UPI00286C9B15|nr:alkaline phosphatase family protein [Hymenobacter sp.]